LESPLNPSGRLADLRLAGAFLTILPVAARSDEQTVHSRGDLAAAAWSFPIVGLFLGAISGVVYALAIWLGCTPWLAATLCVAMLVLPCGALHEDGLGDFADGMGGTSRERRLAIMRDSQAGNFALVALLLVFAVRIGAIMAIAVPGDVFTALLVAAVVSRAAMVVVMHVLPAAREDGLGADAGRPGQGVALAAVLIAALTALLGLGAVATAASLLGAAVAAGLVAVTAHRRLGGQTGDVLGAVQLMSEIGCLLLISLTI
jgi:adenosylcobinamide-GDP ribazoletransferase